MTIEPFDSRFATNCSWKVVKKSDWSVLTSTTLSPTLRGWSGTNDTISHPYPYTTGGPWTLTRTRNDPCLITGILDPFAAGYRSEYDHWSIAAAVANGSDATLVGSTSITDVLARSNPSRPRFDLPYFFSELRELPELVYHHGKDVLKNAANANLTSEFGWELLVQDLRQLLYFQNAVERRALHLHYMFQRGGVSTKGELRKGSYRLPPVITGLSSPGVTMASSKWATAREWCSVSWIPIEDIRNGIPTLDMNRHTAMKVALGDRISASLVWNILPWTWMFDWFSDLGSYLSSRENSAGFMPGAAYIMRQYERGSDHYVKMSPSFKGTVEVPVFHRVSKTRVPTVPASVTASIPILTARQVGILASLAVLKLL